MLNSCREILQTLLPEKDKRELSKTISGPRGGHLGRLHKSQASKSMGVFSVITDSINR